MPSGRETLYLSKSIIPTFHVFYEWEELLHILRGKAAIFPTAVTIRGIKSQLGNLISTIRITTREVK